MGLRNFALDRPHPLVKLQPICVVGMVAAAILLLGSRSVHAEQPFFMGLNLNSGGAYGVSADGRVVVGNGNSAVFRWTRETGVVPIGGGNFIGGVSGDGSTVVGADQTDTSISAFRWTEQSGYQVIGNGLGRASSHDGSVVVGGDFRWEEATGQVSLGFGAMDVSPDGKIIVGGGTTGNGYRAFRWTQETGKVELGTLPTSYLQTNALAMNLDASVVVGNLTLTDSNTEAARWT